MDIKETRVQCGFIWITAWISVSFSIISLVYLGFSFMCRVSRKLGALTSWTPLGYVGL